ncbi:hypothetical protein CDL12_28525 [Handroanthus impetiginosus]|uniref:DUF241 domain-containing protein n=1 Tax=Handroanthus impetiginosus TaxID=429701 RepID=A0A2G9G1H9_9LAMI|nr:hypothetical protein CDL12_28525 [Handroanthus impetiginosus]
MAPKMVTNFRRSLSFPNQPSNNSSKPRKTLHVRSTSLPCRSHPIISQLRDEISELNSWSAADTASRTSAWLCDGLRCLKTVHESLDDLLQLPQTRESLRGGEYSSLIEKLLEDFLRFVDVYGMFQTLVLRLKEEYSAAQIAVRRKDDSEIAVHLKNLSKIAKEIGKLTSNVLSIGKLSMASAGGASDDEAELIEVINDVLKVTVSVSGLLFGGLSNSPAFRRQSCIGLSFGKKTKNVKIEIGIREFQEINLEKLRKKTEEEVKMASKKMHEMEDCIVEIDGCGERSFRSLINTRVSLLNLLTQ